MTRLTTFGRELVDVWVKFHAARGHAPLWTLDYGSRARTRRCARPLRFRPQSAEACRTGCYAYSLTAIVHLAAGAGQDAPPVG